MFSRLGQRLIKTEPSTQSAGLSQCYKLREIFGYEMQVEVGFETLSRNFGSVVSVHRKMKDVIQNEKPKEAFA